MDAHAQPMPVKCVKDLKLDNGHEFKSGETYDAFGLYGRSVDYLVGKNRVELSGMSSEQFSDHFESSPIGKFEKAKLMD